MKKLCALFILTATASMLNAYSGNYGYGDGSYSGCNSGQSTYQQGSYHPQGQYGQYQSPQGQYGQYQGQYQQDQSFQGYNQPGYSQGQYSQNQQGYGYNQSGGNATQNDQQLTSKIQDSLRSAFSSKYNNVNATVNNGNVTLTGTVASQDDRNSLEEKVRGITGVQNINNQVRVQNQQDSSSQSNY
jgi:osmotically-inducible protein OsmY